MLSEKEIFYIVEKRLLKYGYPRESIQFEVKTPLGRRADVVVYENGKPKIVVEIKSDNFKLPEKENELKFHPATRQAQTYAKDLEAPYFTVTNGSSFYWFSMDADGRPKLLPSPILPGITSTTDASMGKNKILQIFYALTDKQRGYLAFDSILINLGFAILSYLKDDKHFDILNEIENIESVDNKKIDRAFLSSAYSTFVQADIKTYPGITLVQAIDEFLQFYMADLRLAQYKLPNWLTGFMVGLVDVQKSKGFLDIYGYFGDAIVAAHQAAPKIPVYSFSATLFSYLWDRVKREALGLNSSQAFLTVSKAKDSFPQAIQSVDRVLVAPPFGARFADENNNIQRSENFYLEKAYYLLEDGGRIVAILPENFLFAASQGKFLLNFVETCQLQAVISLEQFLPNSGIKASILVLEKQSQRIYGNTFIAELTSFDVGQLSKNDQSNKVDEILNSYYAHLTGKQIAETDYIKLIPEQLLFSKESWSVSQFFKTNDETSLITYPTVNLSELCSVIRGANITLDDNGDLPVIGPAAVRAFYIDPVKLDKTSERQIALAKITPKYTKKNDVLIHAIGPHRGEAALVTSEFENLLISRHMIIVRLKNQQTIPEYLAIALNSTFVKKQAYNLSTGSVIASLTPSQISGLVIPLPNIDEQLRIVEKVNSVQSQLRKIQDSLIETETELEMLLDTYYADGANND